MHNPAEDDVFICGAAKKIIEKKADVVHHHRFRFFGYKKGISIPAPISVEKNAIRQILFKPTAHGRFSDPHSAADEIEIFHFNNHPFQER